MKHRILMGLFFISAALMTCQEKRAAEKRLSVEKKNEHVQVNHQVNVILKKQLEYGKPTFDNPYVYTEKDLEVTIPILQQLLVDHGYDAPTEEEFNTRMKEIFHRKINSDSDTHFIYANLLNKCDPSLHYIPNDAENNGMFILKNLNFITELYPLPAIIDYQKLYPTIAQLETTTSKTFKNVSGNVLEKSLWKDSPHLSARRKKNIQTFIARNRYLFNARKEHFNWLITNDQYFMESLVKTFGYTSDPELLKWVVEKTKFDSRDPSEYGKLFWLKDCDEKIKLHANTFKLLQKLYLPNDTTENRFTLTNIKEYLEYLGNEENTKALESADRVKIMANLAYFSEQYKYNPAYLDGSRIMGRLRFFLDEDDIKILERNNYFNLPSFKQWWDNADYDEYFVEECEYNGTCGKDHQPMSMAAWRKQNHEGKQN